ncbi:DegT/DnrJ/EryC1/StrS family aminotransferase [Streptomyces sp. JJ66]|uniref:DegT/DnrJ/EryC1/StrS family aminotransferase n=1 Tax=Streptomyces sp. JJ66 TaxID=2803843 RepID=UPI001C586F09|nr:DegT/DnrJ/EryC1/StrS family aminotransferase [Streptomyces sp. JJ66]MBW1600873.1 DegT/DnrJ/EryC1/StrS family aminotransferase [Streptomyces sp. JJ66]
MGTSELAAIGVRTGDEVVLPSFGGMAVADAVRALGAVPVFADIEPASFCLDPAAADGAVTARTAAVVSLALFGQAPDRAGFARLARRRGIAVAELGGASESTVSLAAARRRQVAAYLNSRLSGVVTPQPVPGRDHAYTAYVIRVPGNGRPDRDAFRRALRSRGVCAEVPVPTPAHRMPAHRSAVWLPETERAVAQTLALPLHGAMTRREVNRVVAACRALGGLVLEPAC